MLSSIVRISSLVYNVTNYYSVTDNIFQLIVDFWHMSLVNDDDDVGFSFAFFVRLCYVLRFFVTLKTVLWVRQGHWKYHRSIERIRLPIDVL